MKRIAIIGAGQSGLQLALGLQDSGYEVTVLSDRTPEQIRAGRVMSSQCMFDWALQTERDRQFHARLLLAELSELAVAEFALVDEIAKRSFGELDPVRTAGKARRAGSDKRN